MSAPTGKWRNARRQLFSHRSIYPFDPEGQGAEASHQEKRKRLCLPRQANEQLLATFMIGQKEPKTPRVLGVFGSFSLDVALERKWLVNCHRSPQELLLLPHRRG